MKILNMLVFCFFMLQSCIPIYDNRVQYKSPESNYGKKCVVKCNYVKNDCYRQCQVNFTNCKLSEKMIDANVRSEPLIKIINNNNSNNDNKNDNKDSCNNKVEECKKSCNGSTLCEHKCDFEVNFCDNDQSFNHSNDFNKFVTEFNKQHNNHKVAEVRKPVSVCYINECNKLCRNDYNLCFVDCGGEIITYTKCVAFCNKNR